MINSLDNRITGKTIAEQVHSAINLGYEAASIVEAFKNDYQNDNQPNDSVFNRADRKEYRAIAHHSPTPKRPTLFDKKASELTQEDIANLPGIRQDYENKKAESIASKTRYYTECQILEIIFEMNLALEHDVFDSRQRGLLYQIAYDKGHAYGYSEVARHYADLVPLVK